jgi:hypothetical protein
MPHERAGRPTVYLLPIWGSFATRWLKQHQYL